MVQGRLFAQVARHRNTIELKWTKTEGQSTIMHRRTLVAKILSPPYQRFPELSLMCRNIRTLFNFDPPVTDEEVRAASLQFVRKITGFNKPAKANEGAFMAA